MKGKASNLLMTIILEAFVKCGWQKLTFVTKIIWKTIKFIKTYNIQKIKYNFKC